MPKILEQKPVVCQPPPSQWYRNTRERAVERRVRDIHTEYKRHAKEADLKYHRVEQGPISLPPRSAAITSWRTEWLTAPA